MTANPHLSPILDAFLQIDTPGHALLITAPWGAGKTFALTRHLASHDHVFVSLFGIDGPAAFDQSLFDAALARDGGQASSSLAQNTAKVMDGAMKIIGGILEKHSNATIDISGQYRRAVLSQLPKILVFDDLERARLPAPQLLALINRFVEHEGKSVILIANEAELDGRAGDEGTGSDDYRRWKEKVIGRTVTLAPDLEPVLAACLDGLAQGPGREALTTRQDLIRSVFTLSRIANLRLLRLALQDCAALVARLPAPLRDKAEPLSGFIGTFIALSLAWNAGGRFRAEELDYHAHELKTLAERHRQTTPPEPTGLAKLRHEFQPHPHVAFDRRWLPGELARAAIVDGHAPDDLITAAMAQARGFQDDLPDWKLLAEWREVPAHLLDPALQRSMARLSAKQITAPLEFLQTLSALLDLSGAGAIAESEGDLTDLALSQLSALQASGGLKGWTTLDPENLLSLTEASMGYVYTSKDHPAFRQVSKALADAIRDTTEQSRQDRLRALLACLKDDPAGFRAALVQDGPPPKGLASHDDPVFLAGDPVQVAATLLEMDASAWRVLARTMEDRLGRQARPALEPERDWLRSMHAAASQKLEGKISVQAAQIRHVLARSFDFLNKL